MQFDTYCIWCVKMVNTSGGQRQKYSFLNI